MTHGALLLSSKSVQESARAAGRPLRYQAIYDALGRALREGRVSPGLVLLEGPVARIFGTSRGPVRKAFEQLHRDGLISRFDGRGFLATDRPAHVPPRRETLTAARLGLAADGAPVVDTRPTAERIYAEVEHAVSTSIAFGQFRVVELSLSQHFGVSRTVAREMLARLSHQGLIEKDGQSHWLAGPLTAKAVADDYEILRLMEPPALRAAAPAIPRETLRPVQQRLAQLIAGDVPVDATILTGLERELHAHYLSCYANRKAANMMARSQLPRVVNRIFFDTLGVTCDEPFFVEHKLVIDHLLYGAYDAAASSLLAHLDAAAARTRRRLKVLSVFTEPALPSYLVRTC
ncbi:GntR family transcriptional regulator [Salinisphaera sp. Q1T1-3]|uniref:GntR family transcriptional regulator n=1 Tax=Salinisphaera sp. Q1T1-3 TaxID=2321229 RepID=UPI001313EE14|nr:GntR family transcriptional regulator [Salinisphaera sp. Q1T1-3]